MSSPFAGAKTIVLLDTIDCPIIPNEDISELLEITRSALEENGIFGSIYDGVEFRAFVGDTVMYHGIPLYWIDETEGKDARLSSIVTFLLDYADYLDGEAFLNWMLVVGDISEHSEIQQAIGLLNSRRKFNVLLAQPPPPQDASSSSSGEELFNKEWLCSRLSAGEQLINKLGIGKTFDKEEPPSLNQIPEPLPSHQVVMVPKDGYDVCLSRDMAQRARTCVFWDTKAYPLPADLNSYDVWQNINDALSERGYYGRVSVTAFLDDYPCPPGFAGCDYVFYLKAGDIDARHVQIARHLLTASRCDSIEPVNYMLLVGDISEHIELLRTIHMLNLKFSFKVILAQPPPQKPSSGELLSKDGICSSLSAGDKLLSQIEQKLPLTAWQERLKAANSVVFWDLVDCPIPVGLTAAEASQTIRSAFEKMNYRGTVTIHAFGEVIDPLVSEPRDMESPGENENTPAGEFLEDMNQSGIVFHNTPTDARREMMREKLTAWAVKSTAPANVMVILRDVFDDEFKLADYLELLRTIDYNVVIARPQNALGQLFDFEWLCSRLRDRFLPQTRSSDSYTQAK
ncbi:hypothetical protein HA466_0293170 [Hirschfeldia incana]|nr:hypothetical protein HA466_0293170 [Hirschfeldia incana]